MNWTQGRINSFITSVIRKGFSKWPPKYEKLALAKKGKKKNENTGRLAEHYECSICKKEFVSSEIEVDHISPVVPTSGWISWDSYINNLFCSVNNLQVICKTCHKIKSKKENEQRKKQ